MGIISMVTNLHFPAPLAIVGFLVLGGALAAALIITAVALLLGKPRLVVWTWRLAALAGVAYFVLLIGFVSRERILHQGLATPSSIVIPSRPQPKARACPEPAEGASEESVVVSLLPSNTRFPG